MLFFPRTDYFTIPRAATIVANSTRYLRSYHSITGESLFPHQLFFFIGRRPYLSERPTFFPACAFPYRTRFAADSPPPTPRVNRPFFCLELLPSDTVVCTFLPLWPTPPVVGYGKGLLQKPLPPLSPPPPPPYAGRHLDQVPFVEPATVSFLLSS